MDLKPGARLAEADLSGIDFTDADLTDAAFERCTFVDVHMQGAVLQGAKFVGCRLARTRFAHADLREAVFEDCSFADDNGHVGAQFAFGRLDEARLRRCDLSFARFERLSAYGLEMDDCNLRGARFTQADFGRSFGRRVIQWSGAMRNCNLELAELDGLRLPRGVFAGSSLREAALTGADLEDADLRGCDLFQALLTGARLNRADLRGAEVSGLNLIALDGFDGVKIDADQQYRLLSALGVDVYAA